MTGDENYRRGSEEERGGAKARLNDARDHQVRATERHEAAKGTSGEMHADIDRREAGERVAAREAWVKWVERDY
jgi:hypothetical protein